MSRIIDSEGRAWPTWKLEPPPEGSPGVGPWVWAQYEAMRRHRDKQGLPELWAHFHELYRGRFFKVRSKFVQVVANLCFKVINALYNNLTDNKPRASIMPNGETPDEVADAWQARYDTWWDQRQQQGILAESVFNSELYGFQVDEMRFNPDLEGGVGEVETKRHNTYGVLCQPGKMQIQAQNFMCTYEAMLLGEIYDKWPKAEGKVKSDAEYSEIMGESRTWTRGNRSKNLQPFGSATNYVIPEGHYMPGDAKEGVYRAQVVRFWVKDYSMVWVDPRTGKPVSTAARARGRPT